MSSPQLKIMNQAVRAGALACPAMAYAMSHVIPGYITETWLEWSSLVSSYILAAAGDNCARSTVTPHRIRICQHCHPRGGQPHAVSSMPGDPGCPLIYDFVGSQSNVMPGSGSLITQRLDQGPTH